MNLIEACNLSKKLDKNIRRKSWPDYCRYALYGYILLDTVAWWIHIYISELEQHSKLPFSLEDFFADDWELVE